MRASSKHTFSRLARGGVRALCIVPVLAAYGCNIISLGFSAIDPPQPFPTIDGPENAHLLDNVHGTLLWRNQSGVLSEEPAEISVVRFPERSSTTIRFEDRPDAFDGPDDRGRFVYRVHPTHKRPQLRLHDLRTNEDRMLFEWSNRPDGEQIIRLSPNGGRLFTSLRMDSGSGDDRSSSRTVALIDIETLERRDLGSAAVRGASWFPDGKRLAIELWADADAIQGRALSSADAGPQDIWLTKDFDRAECLIEVLDTESGDLHFCAFGRYPLVSPDGHSILYFVDAPHHFIDALPHLFDLDTGSDRVLELPGLLTPERVHASEDGGPRWNGVVYGWLSERIVLYDALATSGQRPGYVPAQDLMTGYYPKWTVKAADVDTLEFETVFPSANVPRASLGRSAADR